MASVRKRTIARGQRFHEAFISWYRDGTQEQCKLGEFFQRLDVEFCLRCIIIQQSQTFPSLLLTLLLSSLRASEDKLCSVPSTCPRLSHFLASFKFFAQSGISFCFILCQISKYYWSLRPCLKSFFSVKSSLICSARMVIVHSLFLWWNIPYLSL